MNETQYEQMPFWVTVVAGRILTVGWILWRLIEVLQKWGEGVDRRDGSLAQVFGTRLLPVACYWRESCAIWCIPLVWIFTTHPVVVKEVGDVRAWGCSNDPDEVLSPTSLYRTKSPYRREGDTCRQGHDTPCHFVAEVNDIIPNEFTLWGADLHAAREGSAPSITTSS